MKKITPLKIKVRRTEDMSIFHDTRGDVRRLGEAINAIIEKQNEMIETINKLIEKGEKV
jgi:hypothetical protein